jgi:DtxR family Mn-dependent transcriptional regulator
MSVSAAMQEYLAETYRLAHYQENSLYVSTSALAEIMGVTAPAVTRMVQRLKKAGYLEHEPYQGILLTPKGEQEALMSIRRHRLVERFLVDVMEFGWHEVHDSADDLGAVVSDTVVARMEELSGYPQRCPHGEPIPTAAGIMPNIHDYPLADAQADCHYVVSRVSSHDEEKLKYLDTLGLRPGKKLFLIERAPFEGPIKVEVDGQTCFLGHALARKLRVSTQEEFERV